MITSNRTPLAKLSDTWYKEESVKVLTNLFWFDCKYWKIQSGTQIQKGDTRDEPYSGNMLGASTMKNRELCVVMRLHPDHAQISLNILVTNKIICRVYQH